MTDARQSDISETTGQDGSQNLEVALGNIYPAGLFLRGRLEGVLVAPAVHVEVPWWKDVWVFLIRSPWFPLKLQVDRVSLSVKHDSSEVTASIGVTADGSAAGQVAFNGTDFKNASLVLRRTLGFRRENFVCVKDS